MADTVERLEDDFRFNLFLIKTMIPYLQSVSGKGVSQVVGWLVHVGFRKSRRASDPHASTTKTRTRQNKISPKMESTKGTGRGCIVGSANCAGTVAPSTRCACCNDFLYYLALNLQNGELRPPFTENPPKGPLHTVLHMLPGGTEALTEDEDKWWLQYSDQESEDVDSTRSGQPLIYQRSPDGGAFLSAQPVPRCGAFCYLAVVARAQED
uniref:DUF4485 domain-containing protein n=1 Tax=Timema cristinae TaxID=61476 RepID=A0A7R9HB45_TIMCR|nr:unnamed protein product [Timema cristinae]